jgi:3-hydroxyacyl-CoA dehydrogenase
MASVYAAGGTDVNIFDLSAEQCEEARDYAEQHVAETRRTLRLSDARTGGIDVFDDVGEAVRSAWMVSRRGRRRC